MKRQIQLRKYDMIIKGAEYFYSDKPKLQNFRIEKN